MRDVLNVSPLEPYSVCDHADRHAKTATHRLVEIYKFYRGTRAIIEPFLCWHLNAHAMIPTPFLNPDKALLHEFDTSSGTPARIDSSPLAVALGAELIRLDRARGSIEISFRPNELFLQGAGFLQGGAVAAMLDFALAFVCLASIDAIRTVATINLNVNFLRPAPQAEYLATAEIDRLGKTLAFASARLGPRGGAPVATATSTLSVFTPRPVG